MTLAPTPKMGLYLIEETLEALSREREHAIDEGNSEALALIDAEIGAYLTKEGRKIDSYCALIRQKKDLQDAARKERDRCDAILKAAEAEERRLKEIALAVLQQFGVRELKNRETGNYLRVQANGGLQALDVGEWPTKPDGTYVWVLEEHVPESWRTSPYLKRLYMFDSDSIREALKRGEEIPGARLLERGEHLRCS